MFDGRTDSRHHSLEVSTFGTVSGFLVGPAVKVGPAGRRDGALIEIWRDLLATFQLSRDKADELAPFAKDRTIRRLIRALATDNHPSDVAARAAVLEKLAAEKAGGEGGGHPIASGANIPPGTKKVFMVEAAKTISSQTKN